MTMISEQIIGAHIIAYRVHPNDQMSVLSSTSAWLAQSHNSGARKGAEQCSDAHSYTVNSDMIKWEFSSCMFILNLTKELSLKD